MNQPSKIARLGPHERMTPDETLAEAAARGWDEVVVCGFVKGSDEFIQMSSAMTRKDALWIAENLRLHCLGRL